MKILVKGNLEVESLFLNHQVEKIYCTGDVIAYCMSEEQIKARKAKKGE